MSTREVSGVRSRAWQFGRTSVTDTDIAVAGQLIEAMKEAGAVRDVGGLINLETEHLDSTIRILRELGSISSAHALFPAAPGWCGVP